MHLVRQRQKLTLMVMLTQRLMPMAMYLLMVKQKHWLTQKEKLTHC
jgi:hypothetical protein